MFANRDELAAAVVDYAHRPNLLQRTLDYFIPLCNVRLGRDLESRSNESQTILDGELLGDPMPLPADFGKVRALVWQGATGYVALRARDPLAINGMPTKGSPPSWYNIRDKSIYVRPFVSGNYELNYYAEPVLDATTTTNDVLARHPQLYLYGALIELHVWTQDPDQREAALAFYRSEINEINKQERFEQLEL